MENSKGQSGAIFIILIPIVFIILAFVYDSAMSVIENKKFKQTTDNILTDVLTNSYSDYEETIKELFEQNGYEIEQLSYDYDGEKITVYNSHTYTSFFGQIIGIKSYRTQVYESAYIENNKVVIEEKEINKNIENN